MAVLYFDREWPVESLGALYKKDRQDFGDKFVYLHDGTLDYALRQIKDLFPAIVRKALKLVTETPASYWLHKDPVFFNLCNDGELTWALERPERERPST
jgi:hypothetical protein